MALLDGEPEGSHRNAAVGIQVQVLEPGPGREVARAPGNLGKHITCVVADTPERLGSAPSALEVVNE